MVPAPIDGDVGYPDGSGVDVKFARVVAADVMHAGNKLAAWLLDASEVRDALAHLRRPGLLVDLALVQAARPDQIEYPEIIE